MRSRPRPRPTLLSYLYNHLCSDSSVSICSAGGSMLAAQLSTRFVRCTLVIPSTFRVRPLTSLCSLRPQAALGTLVHNALPRRTFHLARPLFAPDDPRRLPPESRRDAKPTRRKLVNLKLPETLRENIYTLPNLLTASRILACPVLGYFIVQDNFVAATVLLAYAGLTDLVCSIPMQAGWCIC